MQKQGENDIVFLLNCEFPGMIKASQLQLMITE